jgi:hypothetical protein
MLPTVALYVGFGIPGITGIPPLCRLERGNDFPEKNNYNLLKLNFKNKIISRIKRMQTRMILHYMCFSFRT